MYAYSLSYNFSIVKELLLLSYGSCGSITVSYIKLVMSINRDVINTSVLPCGIHYNLLVFDPHTTQLILNLEDGIE